MKTQKLLTSVALAAMALATASCGGGNAVAPVAVTPPPPPVAAPPPPPPTTQTSFSVNKCLNQLIAGRKLVDIIVPDQLNIDLTQPAGFPNGRDFDDPVVDLELASLFLDMTVHSPAVLVNAKLNPFAFDQPLLTTFPYVAAALGTPTLSPNTGTNFNFRTDPAVNYVRVDRAGIPAVSTATILGAKKLAYNDSSPARDVTGISIPDILEGYQLTTDALNDDFKRLGLTPCAT